MILSLLSHVFSPSPPAPALAAKNAAPSLSRVVEDDEEAVSASRHEARPPHGDLGGALSWPASLNKAQRADLYTDNLFDQLTRQRPWSAAELADPRQVVALMLQSEPAQALGKKLQERHQALPGSADDLVLAALQLSLDKAAVEQSPRGIVAGYDLSQAEHWGRHPSIVKQGLIEHLIKGKVATAELAPVAAALLLAHRAPAYWVRDLPETLKVGSHAWVTFSTAVARVEHQTPGATSSMSFAQVMARGNLAPTTPEDQAVERAALHDALKDWGVANGLIRFDPDDHYTDAQLNEVHQHFNLQLEQLNAALLTFATPIPDRTQRALAELRRVYGDKLPLEDKCITLRNSTPGYKGPYSVLDLYQDGKLVITNNAWTSSNAALPYSAVLKKTSLLADINVLKSTFEEDIKRYLTDLKSALTVQVKLMISALPLQTRDTLERGELKLFKLATVPNRGLESHKHEEITNTLLFNAGAPHLNFEVDLSGGQIVSRPEYGILEKADNPYPEFPIPFVKVLAFKSTDEYCQVIYEANPVTQKPVEGHNQAIPDSFNSPRSAYLAEATLAQLDFDKLGQQARGVTTFDTEQTPLKVAHRIVTGLVPFYSAVEHFRMGRTGKGSADLVVDLFGFMVFAGALAKVAKVAQTTASLSTKLAQTARILGRATLSALNPVDGLGDMAKGVARFGRKLGKLGVKGLRRLSPDVHEVTYRAVIEGKDVAKGSMKTADGIELQALAKYDHGSGKWYHYNAKTGEAYGLPIRFNPQAAGLQRPISHSQLLNKLDIALAKKPDMAKAACYEAALRVGIVEGTVMPKTLDWVLHVTNDAQSIGTRYTQAYKHLMGITSSNTTKTFKPEAITESGILNVKRAGQTEPFSHTVYIQRSKTGELFLFNKNDPSLDMAMAARNQSPVTAGACQVYALDNTGKANLQKWLDGPPAREMAYTPTRELNASVLRMAP